MNLRFDFPAPLTNPLTNLRFDFPAPLTNPMTNLRFDFPGAETATDRRPDSVPFVRPDTGPH